MPTHVDLTLPVPYRETIRTRSGAKLRRTAFAEMDVRLPFVDVGNLYVSSSHAPALAVASLRAGDSVKWFAHQGQPIRSLLVDRFLSDRTGFARTDRFWWRFWRCQGLTERDWSDYPFPGWTVDAPEVAEAKGEVVGSDLPRRLATALRIAGTLTSDGERVYKPAPLPVWTVEDLRGITAGMTRLSLILPDKDPLGEVGGRHPRLRPSLGLFGVSDAEAGLRVSRELFGDAPHPGPRRRPVEDTNARMSELAFVKRASDQRSFEAMGTLSVCKRILDGLEGRDAWEVGGDRFEEALADVCMAVDRVRGVAPRGAPAALDDGLARLAGATGHAAEVLARETRADDETLFLLRAATALGTSRRPSIMPEREEADVDALAAPGP